MSPTDDFVKPSDDDELHVDDDQSLIGCADGNIPQPLWSDDHNIIVDDPYGPPPSYDDESYQTRYDDYNIHDDRMARPHCTNRKRRLTPISNPSFEHVAII